MSTAKSTVLEFMTQITPTGGLTLPTEVTAELSPGQFVRVIVIMPQVQDANETAWHHMGRVQLARLSDADILAQEP
jgi:hypothetical protein